jgi:2'-5' RNA ligase
MIEPGRRVLVSPVPGALGERIHAWREVHDPRYAAAMRPHLTLCYQPPRAPLEAIDAQIRHAYHEPISVRIGGVGELGNRDATLCLTIQDTDQLESARQRLFDGTHAQFGGHQTWRWHITLVRKGITRDREALLALAAEQLACEETWTIDLVSLLERGAERYDPIAEWQLSRADPARGISRNWCGCQLQTGAIP